MITFVKLFYLTPQCSMFHWDLRMLWNLRFYTFLFIEVKHFIINLLKCFQCRFVDLFTVGYYNHQTIYLCVSILFICCTISDFFLLNTEINEEDISDQKEKATVFLVKLKTSLSINPAHLCPGWKVMFLGWLFVVSVYWGG